MTLINSAALALMLVYGAVYAVAMRSQWVKQRQCHLITVVFGAAYMLQVLSVLCELCHLRAYATDGKGL